MGKPTGFMDYKRAELTLRAPEERIKDWQEIKTSSLPHKEALRCQAARCMDCGVPFCHSGVMIKRMVSGCPLHNLMPEFNDLVYHGMDDYAYARLNKTNNFPEFTSHVCPAFLPLVTHVADRAWWCGLLPKGVVPHMQLINFCVSKL